MDRPHLYRSATVDWQPHPTLRGIRVKSLENRGTWPEASVTLVEVDAGGVIELHVHRENYESAYVLSGDGLLHVPEGDVTIKAGDGVTIPPQTLHGLENTGSEPMRILAVHIPPLM
jgi:mannose-6-phosphate isomerase-like protein (cupin superfamily)